MGEREKNAKLDLERNETRFSENASSEGGKASFEQLLEQLDIQNAPPAAEGSITQLFSRIEGASAKDSRTSLEPETNNGSVSTPASFETPPSKQEPRNEGPGDFTRIFTKLPPPRTLPPAFLDEKQVSNSSTTSPVKAGDFTQFFQTLEPTGASISDRTASSASAWADSSQSSSSAVSQLRSERLGPSGYETSDLTKPMESEGDRSRVDSSGASFSAEAKRTQAAPPTSPFAAAESSAKFSHGSVEMHEVRATPSPFDVGESSNDTSPAGSAFSQPAGGGFTELLKALGSERPVEARDAPVKAPFSPASPYRSQPPTQGSDERIAFPNFSGTKPPSESSPVDVPRPGEFTQLLRSLQESSENRSASAAAPSSQSPVTERSSGVSNIPSAGPSEFTRIIQSSAVRASDTPLPVPVSQPAPQPNHVAAALPVVPAATVPHLPSVVPPIVSARTKLEKLTPWLLIINGVLLALLVILASLLLLRHSH